jgi:hypothetical protein
LIWLGYTPCDCPGRKKHVEVFVDIGEGAAKTQLLVARVDLSKLGVGGSLDRFMKEKYTQTIFVKGKVPKPNTYARRTWPKDGVKSGLEILE